LGDGVAAVSLDFHDRTTWTSALHGAEHLFLMRPPSIADVERTLNPFVDFARERGVDHVVFAWSDPRANGAARPAALRPGRHCGRNP
jgi:uncharacterized protein YbjT (DUF2867 family)